MKAEEFPFVQPIEESMAADGLSEEEAIETNQKIISLLDAMDTSELPHSAGETTMWSCPFCLIEDRNARLIRHQADCPVLTARELMKWAEIETAQDRHEIQLEREVPDGGV